ncbi:hypothetical protein BSQ44_21480 [Aquibium oceanicum]|uniref:PHB depolymerase family esterase n=1 Tax=Aquibium oceanicum TaxID=1670800 RepID=A0A1L3SZF6_9HYPH|nr:hypothetical protein BSQ44_21480 [Aquibium oceanicum]
MSDTIARLSAMRARQGAGLGQAGATSHLTPLTAFGSNPGALKAAYHVPEDLPDGAPLVVVLHGCTQDAAGYDRHSGWSTLAEEAGFAVLYAEQQRGNNANLCFNWFQPADARRGAGEALSIRQMVEAMLVEHGLDRQRVFVTGLSAGGAMAATMLAAYPDVFAAGAIIAGLPHGSATTVPEAFDRMRGHGGGSVEELQSALRGASNHRGPWPRISVWHGTADHTVAPSNADAIVAQWQRVHGLGANPSRSETAGRLTRQVWCDAAGEAVLEVNMIAGMGHGTPVGHDGPGSVGPYMLDVGISSTRRIAGFWGIAQAVVTEGETDAVSPASRPHRDATGQDATKAAAPKRDTHQPAAEATGVQKIIEDALRTAGLMH